MRVLAPYRTGQPVGRTSKQEPGGEYLSGENRLGSQKEGDSITKTYNNLYPQIYDFWNLYSAYEQVITGKRYAPISLKFTFEMESNLIQLQNALIWKTYRTGKYYNFYVYEPKKRMVSALPFKDRVAQQALCNIIEPLFEAKMIHGSYACRIGKGTHKAADRTQEFILQAQAEWESVVCLKGDIEKYYPSVNHDGLKRIIRRTIACKDTLWLIDGIIDSGADPKDINPKNLPIGNRASQLCANVYMGQLDHFVKEVLQVKYYVRYMDDFIILGPNTAYLWDIHRQIEAFLREELSLELNKKTDIFPISRGIDFVGYRIWPTHRLLRKRSIKKFKRKLRVFKKKYATGDIGYEKINRSVQSWIGHAKHADTYRLRRKLFSEFKLVKTTENTRSN